MFNDLFFKILPSIENLKETSDEAKISVECQVTSVRRGRVFPSTPDPRHSCVFAIRHSSLDIRHSPLGERLLQLFLLLMGEVARDDLEMRRRLEGLHDFVRRHRSEEQE
jgi:hypothetical protein